MANLALTEKEKQHLENLDNDVKRGREFGRLNVKRYVGNDPRLKALNVKGKTLGTTQMIMEKGESIWYLYTEQGKFAFPEPAEGIDTLLDIEFKRKNV